MQYTAKTNIYTWPEQIGTQDDQQIIMHSWTVGKKYNVVIDDTNLTAQFESDGGMSQVLPILITPQQLLLDTFGVDITNEVNEAIEREKRYKAQQ